MKILIMVFTSCYCLHIQNILFFTFIPGNKQEDHGGNFKLEPAFDRKIAENSSQSLKRDRQPSFLLQSGQRFWELWCVSKGAIHSTKIPDVPTGKSGPPQKVDPFFRNFSGWTEPIH